MRKVFVARNVENTVNTNPCPIIFVPGVMVEHGEAYNTEQVRLQVQKLIIKIGNLQPLLDKKNEEERKRKEEERKKNWGKGVWRKDV